MRAASFALLLLAGCTAPDVCDGISGTCVSLHVTGAGLHEVDQLAVDFSGAFSSAAKLTPPSPEKKSLPIDLAATIAQTGGGSVTAHVVGWLGGVPIGEGSMPFTLVKDARNSVSVTLTSGLADLAMPGDDLPPKLDGSVVTDGALPEIDGPMPIIDLAIADLTRPPDLFVLTGCKGYTDCLSTCPQDPLNPGTLLPSCVEECQASTKSESLTLYAEATIGCASRAFCIGDGGNLCTAGEQDGTSTSLSTACTNCINNAYTNNSSAVHTACLSDINACNANLP